MRKAGEYARKQDCAETKAGPICPHKSIDDEEIQQQEIRREQTYKIAETEAGTGIDFQRKRKNGAS